MLLQPHPNTCARNHTTGNSVAAMIKAVNGSSASSFASGGLSSIKAKMQPFYPAARPAVWSFEAKVFMSAVVGWSLFRLDAQARAHEWIVDLSLNVLQAAWLISFASFLPFRGIFLALRGMTPHTAAPLQALRSSVFLKP